MGFAGNLKTVSLPDVFQLIVSSKKTGMLSISRDEARRDIYFRDGLLVYASSNSREDLFGNLLLKKGRISKAELDEILNTENEGKKIGALLVEKKLFSKEEIFECLKMQIEEIVYALFGWKDGKFELTEGKAPPASVIQTELNPMNMIMEGMRRIDEWEELKKILPPDDAFLEIVPEPAMKSEEMNLSRSEFMVLALIGAGKTLQKIVEESFLDQFLTCKSIANLLNMGLLKIGKHVAVDKTAEVEQKALIELLANVYIGNLIFIFSNLKEKLGAKGERVIYETFEENRMFYPVLNQIFSGRDGQVKLDLFVELYKRLPEEARIWRLVSNFNSLMNDYLIAVQKNLGNKIYRRVLSEIKINIQNTINRNRQIAMKYGLEEEFSRALRDR
ncbi:MAG: hypothetical protein A2W25_05820 [candidate division Zixibacteria bacterium RBG_16_53_22]|nr:MAG: hypothetical protein A2W25_05820 [candidate division Zixibacteria bacterium RBG_16_53_22]